MVTRSPFLDAAGLQHIGEAADFVVQLPVGDVLAVLGIVAFPDDGGLVAALLARCRSMQLAATFSAPSSNHLICRFSGSQETVADLGEGLDPVQPRRFLAPKAVRVLHRLRHKRAHIRAVIKARFFHSPGTGMISSLIAFLFAAPCSKLAAPSTGD